MIDVQVSEYRWRRRVLVTGYRGHGHGVFQFHMVRQCTGYTASPSTPPLPLLHDLESLDSDRCKTLLHCAPC